MCHFEVSFDGLLNVAYWLDSEVAASLIDVRCYLRSGHPEFNVRLYEAIAVKAVLICVA